MWEEKYNEKREKERKKSERNGREKITLRLIVASFFENENFVAVNLSSNFFY